MASTAGTAASAFSLGADPLSLIALLTTLSLAPFIAIMLSSFMKIVIVINLIRNALGVQQIPPNIAVNGLAIILTIYIMTPVMSDTYAIIQKQDYSNKTIASFVDNLKEAKGPMQAFLAKHSNDREKKFFINTAKAMWSPENAALLDKDHFMVLVPAFTVSELTSAFQIGFLMYLPFIAIDLVVSNILLALGMMMVSPMTISLPFKLLLFVLIEGWSRLVQGLVLSYK